ncbi:MAG TPA: DNA-directed RNA polymerase subunit omega [Vicinamibacterales bacterium]|nr:DNA-directed RNA polymerase subunit omega [Vicinamibacterales bacterium]
MATRLTPACVSSCIPVQGRAPTGSSLLLEAESVVHRSAGTNAFEFVTVAALRAAQLMRGCRALVPEYEKSVLTAQAEVAAGKVQALPRADSLSKTGR